MTDASFNLKGYNFPYVRLDFSNIQPNNTFKLNIQPSGTFYSAEHAYKLRFRFSASLNGNESEDIEIVCQATYEFMNSLALEEIPDYFYPNSIAIIFPYLRAFVSTLTLQANFPPVLLPTKNLSALADELRANTTVAE